MTEHKATLSYHTYAGTVTSDHVSYDKVRDVTYRLQAERREKRSRVKGRTRHRKPENNVELEKNSPGSS